MSQDLEEAAPLVFKAVCLHCEWEASYTVPDATRYSRAGWRKAWLALATHGAAQVRAHVLDVHGIVVSRGRVCGWEE